MLLELEGVEARYGPVQALHGVSLQVAEGEVAAVLGGNGAGKTTTLRAISNTVRRSGEIRFAGESLGRKGPEATARLGIAHVPEGRGTFAELTVQENLRLGAYTRRGAAKEDLRRVCSYFTWIERRRDQQAGTLSGGEQQMLAIGRALMAEPRLLLLDEPSFGLAPMVVREIARTVQAINREQGVSVLLVEQNARMAFGIASRVYVMETGRVALSGSSSELTESPHVKAAYLGGSA